MAVRVTQAPLQVVEAATPNLRVTQVALQVIYPSPRALAGAITLPRVLFGSGVISNHAAGGALTLPMLVVSGAIAHPADRAVTGAITLPQLRVSARAIQGGTSGDVIPTPMTMVPEGLLAVHNWCRANGVSVALHQDSQRPAKDLLDELGVIANSAWVYSGDRLKAIPYDEVSNADNGAVYIAPTASGPIAFLTDRDFFHAKDDETAAPVKITRKRRASCDNVVSIEHIDRDNDYRHNVTSQPDQNAVIQYGPRKGGQLDTAELGQHKPSGSKSYLTIHRAEVAQIVTSIQVKRSAAGVNEYTFTLKAEWFLLEAMDLVALTDERLGLDEQPVRLTKVEEKANRTLECVADEFIYGLNHPDLKAVTTLAASSTINVNVDPGVVNTPIILQATASMSSVPQLWFIISGADPNFGGAIVFLSTDGGVSYDPIGNCGPAVTGALTAGYPASPDPDTTDTLAVDLTESSGVLVSDSPAQADVFADPMFIAGPDAYSYELVCPTDVTLTAAFQYSLDAYIRRGTLGTPITAHLTGQRFAVINGAVAKVDIDPAWVGRTLLFKFAAYNKLGSQQSPLDGLTAYPYTLSSTLPIPQPTSNPPPPAPGPQPSSLAALIANNTSASGNYVWNSANPYVVPSFDTGLSHDKSLNASPGNVSKRSILEMSYSGAAHPVFAHYMPWWADPPTDGWGPTGYGTYVSGGGHIDIDLNDPTASVVNRRLQDIKSRGYTGIIIDWYGPDKYLTTVDNLFAGCQALSLRLALMVDQGSPRLRNPGTYGYSSVTAAYISLLQYINDNYASSAAYWKIGGRPAALEFGVRAGYPSLDWTAIRNAIAAFSQGNPYLIFKDADNLSRWYVDGAYAWPHVEDITSTDPYALSDMRHFCQLALQNPGKVTIPCAYKGFFGYLATWWGPSSPLMPQNNGDCWFQTWNIIKQYFNQANPAYAVQVATWNDYEEGTEVESGIDHNLAITASISGTDITWTTSGSEAVIAQYQIFASTNGGMSLTLLGAVAVGAPKSFSLASLASGTYNIWVEAEARPHLHNKTSLGIPYTV